jgi:hypothetical protein
MSLAGRLRTLNDADAMLRYPLAALSRHKFLLGDAPRALSYEWLVSRASLRAATLFLRAFYEWGRTLSTP